jgi:hypothetical protein
MAKPIVWGGDLEITALKEILDRDITLNSVS